MVLTAAIDKAGVETFRVAFLLLHGPDQFGFVPLAALDAPVFGYGFDLSHIHRRCLLFYMQPRKSG